MYIYYDENLKVTGFGSSKMEVGYIEVDGEEFKKIESELLKGFESYKVDLENKTVVFDSELEKEYKLKKKETELLINHKEVEISGLMIENEVIKRHLNIPATFDKPTKWEQRIKNNYVTNEQIEVLKELNLI